MVWVVSEILIFISTLMHIIIDSILFFASIDYYPGLSTYVYICAHCIAINHNFNTLINNIIFLLFIHRTKKSANRSPRLNLYMIIGFFVWTRGIVFEYPWYENRGIYHWSSVPSGLANNRSIMLSLERYII